MNKRLIFFIIVLLIALFLYVNNKWIIVTRHEVNSEKIAGSFDGLKIMHLSDLHDATFGKTQTRLIQQVKNEKPDVIFFTGDFIDSNRYKLERSLKLIDGIKEIAPVYYVLGNHEVATNRTKEIIQSLQLRGVHVLQNEQRHIRIKSDSLVIAGIDDPLMNGLEHKTEETIINENIEKALADSEPTSFRILLSHRPEFLSVYAKHKIDVVFSGHAHGGQIRIPFLGGVLSPGQGIFPKYTSGVIKKQKTSVVISRGLGNSIMPFRILNLPEIVVVTLKSGKS